MIERLAIPLAFTFDRDFAQYGLTVIRLRSPRRPLSATQHDFGVLERPFPSVFRGFGLAHIGSWGGRRHDQGQWGLDHRVGHLVSMTTSAKQSLDTAEGCNEKATLPSFAITYTKAEE